MAAKKGRYVCPACLMEMKCITLERVYTRPQGSSLVPRGWMCPECMTFYPVLPEEHHEKDEEENE